MLEDTPNGTYWANPRRDPVRSWPAPTDDPLAFHRSFEDYRPTRLWDLRDLAEELGLERLWVKDETQRLGLPSFKMLGASWASSCLLRSRYDAHHDDHGIEALRALPAVRDGLEFVAATDGNHGQAVAHMARLLGLPAHILVPHGMAAARIEAIESEGATVEAVDGTYDAAILRAASYADERRIVVSDTAWPGYEVVPRWVVGGYETIFLEIEDELRALGEEGPDLVMVQIGVGSLASAVVAHYGQLAPSQRPAIVGVEPIDAACALRAAQAGEPTLVAGPHESSMVGLNAGLPALIAMPFLLHGIDAYVSLRDAAAEEAIRALCRSGLRSGESGAAGLAGLMELARRPGWSQERPARALVVCTEGATDPVNFARITQGMAEAA